MANTTLPVIIFDFDGTLVDTAAHFVDITNTLSQKHNFKSLLSSDLDVLRDSTLNQIIRDYFKQVAWYKLPRVLYDFRAILAQTAHETKFFPEMVEILHTLKSRGYQIGLLTSSPAKVVDVALKKADLETFFDFKKTSASIFHKEKDLKKLIQKAELNPENLFYIGDEVRDIVASRKANIKCLSVAWGFCSLKLLQKHHPDYIISSPEELLQHFTGL